jgi:hypothetical protein
LIALPSLPAAPALVRVQEGPSPVDAGAGRAAAERFVRARLRAQQMDSHAWRAASDLNWVVTLRQVAFFARGKFIGTDKDFGNLGQLGQLTSRRTDQAAFLLTVYRSSDPRCCPQGRTITMRFRWNGARLVASRTLLRAGSEPAEGLQLPSRNIGCIFSRSPRYVRCDVRTGLQPPPPRPAGCDLDWAYGLQMTARSRAKTFCAGDTALSTGPILAYGATLKLLGFSCLSRRSGLRCANSAGHGFFLARQRWETF